MNNKTAERPAVDNSMVRVLQEYNYGTVLTDAAQAVRRLTDAVSERGGAGHVVVRLNIKRAGNANEVTAEVMEKLPKLKPKSAIFFTGKDGNLTREDPDQIPLDLKTLDGGQAEEAAPLKQVVRA